MRAFVTGLTGFVGPHLARMLTSKGFEVVGLGFESKTGPEQRLPKRASAVHIDIRDYEGLRQILRDTLPDQIYHLAAISNVVTSFKDPRMTYDVNVGGTLNLFEALRELDIRPRIVHVSSAHVYRSIDTEAGLDEDSPVRLLTPYAASKFMCESLATQYVEAYGFQTMTVRPFNHVGPGQPTGFVCADFARQIAAIKLGLADPVLHVGNLAPVRDFTDVRDTVEAYWIVATQGVPGEIYNVGSQHPIRMQEIVSKLCMLADVQVRIEVDPQKFRPIETQCLFGNSSRISALGWKPRIKLEQTLKDILDWWLINLVER
jgi:GDP-4-dehydro-6-deoxy-D-mannose reductase